MREIRKSGSEGGARQTNVSFLPLSAESSSPCLGVSVRGLRRRRCGGNAVAFELGLKKLKSALHDIISDVIFDEWRLCRIQMFSSQR